MAKVGKGLKSKSLALLFMVLIVIAGSFVILSRKDSRPPHPPKNPPKTKQSEPFVFQCFWQHNFSRKQAFSIKSLLVTQNEFIRSNPDTTVIIWTEDNANATASNVWLQQMESLGVQVRHYNATLEAMGTPLEGNNVVSRRYKRTAFHSDWARLIELFKHGGLYFDLDTMFLKDVRPLIAKYGEFGYPWITRRGKINNAFLHFKKEGAAITDILTRANKERKATGLHGFTGFLISQKPKDLNLVPYEVIDFCWIDWTLCPHFDFTWFFKPWNEQSWVKKRKAKSGLEGSYVYHWHNCWKEPIVNGSLFEKYEKEFDFVLGVPHNVGNNTF